jgi:hypothetical protein
MHKIFKLIFKTYSQTFQYRIIFQMMKTMFDIHKVITNNKCLDFFHEKKYTKKKKKVLSFIIKSKQHVHYNLGQFNTNYIIFRNLQIFKKNSQVFYF